MNAQLVLLKLIITPFYLKSAFKQTKKDVSDIDFPRQKKRKFKKFTKAIQSNESFYNSTFKCIYGVEYKKVAKTCYLYLENALLNYFFIIIA